MLTFSKKDLLGLLLWFMLKLISRKEYVYNVSVPSIILFAWAVVTASSLISSLLIVPCPVSSQMNTSWWFYFSIYQCFQTLHLSVEYFANFLAWLFWPLSHRPTLPNFIYSYTVTCPLASLSCLERSYISIF